MNVAIWLARHARQRPTAPGLILGTRCVANFGEWAERSARMAGGLHAAGWVPGDRVVLLARNSVDYLEALLAIWWAGLVAVPVNAKLHAREAGYIVAQSGARGVFASPDWEAELGAVLADARDTRAIVFGQSAHQELRQHSQPIAQPVDRAVVDPAWLFYTSGTTGRPKGAVLTHGNLAAMALNYFAQVDGIAAGDAILHGAPLSHGSGLYALPHLLAGAAQGVPESGAFDESEIIHLLAQLNGVTMFAAPTIVKRLVASPDWSEASLAGLKTLVYGGGPMYAADALQAIDRLPGRLAQIYGQGESPMTITVLPKAVINERSHPRHLARLASVGVPFAGVEVMLRNETGRPLELGEIGEVCVCGPTVMAGYWQDAAATARALRDGWLWTGDMGSFDEEGFLTLKDRSKDLIISGGSNVYPREVEEVLLTHPGVAEVSVIGKRDDEWGEVVVACVVGRDGFADAAALDALCLAQIARFKRPKHYQFLSELPKNAYGKVLKTALRDRFGNF